MFSFGRSKTEARITGEFYVNAIHVMEGATALDDDLPAQPGIPRPRKVDNYVALPPREAFNIEYWLLEEAKLKRCPRRRSLSRKIAVVIGASPGIGRAIAARLGEEGAHVVAADLAELAEEAAVGLKARYMPRSPTPKPWTVPIGRRCAAQADAVALQYGGVDILVCVAAVFFPPDESGRITEGQWRTTFDVNLLGSSPPTRRGR